MGRWKHGNCSESEESEAGLCFTKCPDEAFGVGPFCWFSCPNEFEYSAGAICCVNESTCKAKAVDLAVIIPTYIVHLVADRENPADAIPQIMKAVQKRCQYIFATEEEKKIPTGDAISTPIVIDEVDEASSESDDDEQDMMNNMLLKLKRKADEVETQRKRVKPNPGSLSSAAPHGDSILEQELFRFFPMDPSKLAPYILDVELDKESFKKAKKLNGFNFQPTGSPLDFWHEHQKSFPILYRVHLESYSHTATSVLGESLFSRAKHHQPASRRGPMRAETLAAEVTLTEAGENMPTVEQLAQRAMSSRRRNQLHQGKDQNK